MARRRRRGGRGRRKYGKGSSQKGYKKVRGTRIPIGWRL